VYTGSIPTPASKLSFRRIYHIRDGRTYEQADDAQTGRGAGGAADAVSASKKQRSSPNPCSMNAGTAASTIFTEPHR
jgi:hypothetical protein